MSARPSRVLDHITLLLAAALGSATGACTTEQPRATATASDSGTAAAPHEAAPPAPMSSPSSNVPTDDGGSGSPRQSPATPSPPTDAPAGPATHAAADATSSASTATGTATGTAPAAEAGAPPVASAFDRILVKPKTRTATADELKALVEGHTRLVVQRARRTAGSWFMVEFAPAPGGRTAEGQQTIVQGLLGAGLFEHVEADRLMQVKLP